MSTDYVHSHRHSFLAHGVKAILRLIRRKHILRKELRSGHIPQEPASVPRLFHKQFRIQHHTFSNGAYWHLAPHTGKGNATVVYIHGGSYVHNITRHHWNLIGSLADQTGASFYIPDYPLAPALTCNDVYDFMHALHNDVLAPPAPERLILMGDSSGGAIALGLADEWKGHPVRAHHTIAISPWLDIMLRHPETAALETHDTMLSLQGLRMAGRAYAGNLPENHRRHSPKYANPAGPISLFTGTHDILYPDIRDMRDRLRSQGNTVHYFEYPQMFHVWVAVTALDEAKHAIGQMADIIIKRD